MTYAAYDTSVQDGLPLEIYRFQIGTRRYCYANGVEPVSYLGLTFDPQQIERDQPEMSPEFGKAPLTITLPRDAGIAAEFNAGSPEEVVDVTLFRRQLLDGAAEWITAWKGRVVAPSFGGSTLTLKCESLFTTINRAGAGEVYEVQCPYALYDARCGALKDAFKVDGTIASVNGAVLQSAALAGKPDGYFAGGFVLIAGKKRMIIDHTGDHATTLWPYAGVAVGAAATFYAGCDRSLQTCHDKFANDDNYGGYPWIPEKNPFSGDAIV